MFRENFRFLLENEMQKMRNLQWKYFFFHKKCENFTKRFPLFAGNPGMYESICVGGHIFCAPLKNPKKIDTFCNYVN